MTWQERYERAKARLFSDTSICQANRSLFDEFFRYEEHKLKRQNDLRDLDDPAFKTLYGYVLRLNNVNRWFDNKRWKDLTREDIRQVYDDLEDGKIVKANGQPYEDRKSYYNKIFKSKPFRLAGKSELAKDVIEFSVPSRKEVRFVTEEDFRKLVSVLNKPQHLLLFWLAWDIGENIGALLQLTRRQFTRQINSQLNEQEYLLHLPQQMLKRSRKPRTEPTLFSETVRYADMVLRDLDPDEPIFSFGHRQAAKILQNAARKTGATIEPTGEPVRWKDLRSGMACHLLKLGWPREEVNARLGHVPHSHALDAYINFMALDRNKAKRRLSESRIEQVQQDLAQAQVSGKHHAGENQRLREELQQIRIDLDELHRLVRQLIERRRSLQTLQAM